MGLEWERMTVSESLLQFPKLRVAGQLWNLYKLSSSHILQNIYISNPSKGSSTAVNFPSLITPMSCHQRSLGPPKNLSCLFLLPASALAIYFNKSIVHFYGFQPVSRNCCTCCYVYKVKRFRLRSDVCILLIQYSKKKSSVHSTYKHWNISPIMSLSHPPQNCAQWQQHSQTHGYTTYIDKRGQKICQDARLVVACQPRSCF